VARAESTGGTPYPNGGVAAPQPETRHHRTGLKQIRDQLLRHIKNGDPVMPDPNYDRVYPVSRGKYRVIHMPLIAGDRAWDVDARGNGLSGLSVHLIPKDAERVPAPETCYGMYRFSTKPGVVYMRNGQPVMNVFEKSYDLSPPRVTTEPVGAEKEVRNVTAALAPEDC
jgi:hypothetical protein